MTVFGANTHPENQVKDKHQVFDAAQTPPRHRHPAKDTGVNDHAVRTQQGWGWFRLGLVNG